jgi:hypothetical protein
LGIPTVYEKTKYDGNKARVAKTLRKKKEDYV